jgi:predicted ABC-type ATPase
MNETELKKLSEEAIRYVKENRRSLIERFVGNTKPVKQPVSIFMAGSPGAGKTEFSINLIEEILGAKNNIVRIDPDAIRTWLPQYVPGKAEYFQGAVAVGVNKLHDHLKSKSFSFLLDGTFSKLNIAENNIRLSLDKRRPVFIQYVIQPPEIAWQFTKDREQVDGRNITREDFIEQFISARDVVAAVKKEFGSKIQVDLVERNLKTGKYEPTFNISNLDRYLPKKYSKDDLEKLL